MLEVFKLLMIAMLTSNVVFSLPYGVCSYLGVSKSKKSAVGMGFALTFVAVLASIICYLLNKLLVLWNIEYMSTLCFILVVASVVQFVEMFIKKFSPSLYKSLGIYLPLITTNCVVLYICKQVVDMDALLGGLSLTNSIGGEFGDFIFMLVYSIGTALGFFLALYIFSVLRERLQNAPIPKGFSGVAVGLLCTAIMAMIFMNGLVGIF